MTWSGLMLFGAVYVAAAAAPGPGMAALVARVLARGLTGAVAFGAGFVVGDLLWFGVAALGLAAIAQTFSLVFLIIKYIGAAYLFWLAWKLWRAPAAPAALTVSERSERPARLFLTGLLITLGNPKVIVFFLALLPTVVELSTLTAWNMVQLALMICLLLSTVLGLYALAAARARRLFTSPRMRSAVNRGTGVIMAGAAVMVATKS